MNAQTIVLICAVVAVASWFGFFAEARDAWRWRRRAGHWHAHRVAGAALWFVGAALFTGIALS